MDIIIKSKQNFDTTDKAMQSFDSSIAAANYAKDMAMEEANNSVNGLTIQDRIELLKVAASLQKNAIDAAKVIVLNDTLQHRIFHDNRMIE